MKTQSQNGPIRRSAHTGLIAAALFLVAIALVVSGCGSSGDASAGSGDTSASTGGSSTTAGAPEAGGADVASAKRAIAPYVGKPSDFPVHQPLKKEIPAGTEFSFIQCSAPVCALYGELLEPAVDALGASMTKVKAGASATGVQAAATSIASKEPAAVLLPAIAGEQLGTSIQKLTEEGVHSTAISIMEGEKYGIEAEVDGEPTIEAAGTLLADWVVAKEGSDADVVFYTVPELAFSAVMQQAFEAEMEKICPECSVRSAPIPEESIGTKAPALVVSDLQSHPDTNVAVFASMEAATGLPAAMSAASVDVTTIGYAPAPGNLEDIKNGKLTAGLAVDLATAAWMQVDETARLINDEPLTKGEHEGFAPIQFLEQKDITFDTSKGWTGYPDFAQRFEKLWHGQ